MLYEHYAHCVLLSFGCYRNNFCVSAAAVEVRFFSLLEIHNASNGGIESIIASFAHIGTAQDAVAALFQDNLPSEGLFAMVNFDA